MPHAMKVLKKAAVCLLSQTIQIYLRELYHSKRRNQVGSTFSFLFSRCLIRIPAQRPATVIKFPVIFLSPFR